jgi:drug/metabolite transporter (DMT)-like permease
VHYVWFLCICAVWGSSFILMKRALVVFSPGDVAAWRVASGAIVLALAWWWEGRKVRWKKGELAAILYVVLVGYAWPYAIQPEIVARHGGAFGGMIVSFVPLLTVLVSVPVLGIRPTARQLAGVLGGMAFMGLLFADGLRRAIPLSDLLLAGTVPFGYATANTVIRKKLADVPPLWLTLISLCMASAVLFPVSWCWPAPSPSAEDRWWPAAAALGFLGVVGTGIATYYFNRLILERGPLFAGMATYLIPLGAVLWGWADQEQVTLLQLTALGGILAMVALVQIKGRSPAATPRS